jgi:hypothetical protein
MATRRPSDTSSSTPPPPRPAGVSTSSPAPSQPRTSGPGKDVQKEIPKVIKADEAVTASPTTGTSAAPPRGKKSTPPLHSPISEEVRRKMVAESAYHRAERRGFAPGYEHEDWLAAEAEIDSLLKARSGATPQ